MFVLPWWRNKDWYNVVIGRTDAFGLGESFNVVCWIGAHGQETDHRRPAVALCPHHIHVQHHALGKLQQHSRNSSTSTRQNSAYQTSLQDACSVRQRVPGPLLNTIFLYQLLFRVFGLTQWHRGQLGCHFTTAKILTLSKLHAILDLNLLSLLLVHQLAPP